MLKQMQSVLLVALAIGCTGTPAGPPVGVSGSTLKTSYIQSEEVKILVRNETGERIFLSACCGGIGYVLEKKSGMVWTEENRWGIPCLAMCPTMIKPVNAGETYTQAIELSVGPGRYRLRVPYGQNPDDTMRHYFYTNEFVIQ